MTVKDEDQYDVIASGEGPGAYQFRLVQKKGEQRYAVLTFDRNWHMPSHSLNNKGNPHQWNTQNIVWMASTGAVLAAVGSSVDNMDTCKNYSDLASKIKALFL